MTKEGNLDMATIQTLKNCWPESASDKAHQLLALIYIKDGEYARARKLLMSVLKIDRNNTLAQLYLKEIEEAQQLKKSRVRVPMNFYRRSVKSVKQR